MTDMIWYTEMSKDNVHGPRITDMPNRKARRAFKRALKLHATVQGKSAWDKVDHFIRDSECRFERFDQRTQDEEDAIQAGKNDGFFPPEDHERWDGLG